MTDEELLKEMIERRNDDDFNDVRRLSLQGFECAKNALESNQLISKEEADANIKLLISKLETVKEDNKAEAQNLVSEGILDFGFASGIQDITSLRLGHLINIKQK